MPDKIQDEDRQANTRNTEANPAAQKVSANEDAPSDSPFPVDHATLQRTLKSCVKPSGGPSNGGLDNHMWAAVIDRMGIVRAVCFSGKEPGDQWPGSRAIAIEKANTANAFSLPGSSLSTANLYAGAQPGGFLYGVLETNPVDVHTMYAGDGELYGTANDPMVGKKASGAVVFGGGLALYDEANVLVGALGVSGDTSPADHNVAWRLRKSLGLDRVPGGVTADNNDGIIFDIGITGRSSSGYGHPKSGLKEDDVASKIGASAKGK
ncbi:MAG TPA: heme-binding protein [Rhizomicrobium sp.]|jgi:uncharacterized protein GlcG (DUF336 family)